MIYPCDAITIPFVITGQQTITLLSATSSNRTILDAHIINYADSISEGSFIDAGSVRIAKAYYKQGFDNRQMTYKTSNAITAGSSGTTNAYGQIVYVDRDILTTSATCDIPINNINPTFTYGEILTNYFLFIIMVALVFGFILKFFKGKK